MLRALAEWQKPPGPGGGRRAGTKAEEEAAVEWGTGFPVRALATTCSDQLPKTHCGQRSVLGGCREPQAQQGSSKPLWVLVKTGPAW